MKSSNAKEAEKMRLCRALSSAVLAPLQDGIEKVRGSTPLISTTPKDLDERSFLLSRQIVPCDRAIFIVFLVFRCFYCCVRRSTMS